MKGKMNVISIILVIVGAVIFYMAINAMFAARHADTPIAQNGWLDLREQPLTGHAAIRLDGQWEFIPGKLVDPSRIHAFHSDLLLVDVPSSWTAYKTDGTPLSPYMSATYRLRIQLHEADRELAIKTTNVRLSNRLFVNGQELKQSGFPQEDASYRAYNVPYTKSFHVDLPVVEIVMHVANFHLAMGGGIISSIYLGDDDSIRKISQSKIAYDWIMVAVFLTIGIFGLGYYFQIGRDLQLAMFALFCFFVALYRVTHGERLFSALLPSMPYEWFQKFQYGSATGIGIFLLLFYHLALRDLSNRYIVRLGTGVGVILTLVLALPAPINSRIDVMYGSYLLIAFGYIAYLSVCTVLLRKSGSLYLLLSCVSLMALIITEYLDLTEGSSGFIHLHVLPFVYLISVVLYLSRQFANDYLKKEQLNQQLLHHDRLKDEFLAKTSHEFRTPLHGIISISESMLGTHDRPVSDGEQQSHVAEQQEKLRLIASVARRLSGLVNDILVHAKLRQGEYALERKPFELQSTVQLVAAFCGHLVDKQVEIKHHSTGQPCYVVGDEERVRQILYNLVGNAVKFTKQGHIDIRYARRDGFVYVSVSDTGRGIPAEDLDVIFEPFRQGNAHTSGTGLGLSIAKQLVELQGGQLTATSQPGLGSTFTFSLPVSGDAPGARAAGAATPAASRGARAAGAAALAFAPGARAAGAAALDASPGRPRILLIDDDHLNLSLLIDALAPEQYSLVAVDSGAQALELLERDSSFSLVLLDIMMPEISGYEVCSTIRQTHSLVDLPVLMLTAAILPEDVVAAFQSGANDFLHKPLDVSELKTRVRNLIMMKDAAMKATELEVSFLQAQIKPHFIYNVLNSVLSLSYTNPERSRKLLLSFSAFLRGSFVFKTVNNRVPLEQELDLVRAYVEIEQARYPDQFQFELNVDSHATCMIPPLVIQPLVENAIRHGMPSPPQRCTIAVSVARRAGNLHITISDTGNGIAPAKLAELGSLTHGDDSTGVGLRNIIKRIRQIPHARMDITSEIGKGTRITIVIPESA